MYLVSILVLLLIVFLLYLMMPQINESFIGKRNVLNNTYNLLTNGSFQNNKDIEGAFKEGDNVLVRLDNNPNCDISQYVLKQSKNAVYNIPVNVKQNFNYRLKFWSNESDKNIVGVTPNYQHNTLLKYNDNRISDKKTTDGKTWYQHELLFTVPPGVNKILIKFFNKNYDELFLTDIILLPYLKHLTNFNATLGLETFLDAQNKFSCSDGVGIIWNDLSNNGFIYKWNSKPTWNSTDGYFKTKNNTLTGPTAYNVLGTTDEFSVVVRAKTNSTKGGLVDGTNSINIPGSPGNTGEAIRLDIPNNYGKLRLTVNGQALMKDDDEFIRPNNDNIYTVTFSGDTVHIWINESLYQTYTGVKRPYFSRGLIKINEKEKLLGSNNNNSAAGGAWDADLYSFLVYSRVINENEIEYINHYLRFHPQPIITPEVLVDIKPLKKLVKPTKTPIDVKKKGDCPTAYLKNGEYIVDIPKDSKYRYTLGVGPRSYGTNKEKANKIYKENFPDCKVPDALKFDRVPHNVCPYIFRRNNPCNEPECKYVDWSQMDVDKMGLNEGCRKHISHYCHIPKHREHDPMCRCWKEGNKYDPECQKMRKMYEPPEDYGFSINIFDIDEHPDFKNYIRKDRIPCWNCNLTAPAPKDISRTWKNN